MATTAYTSSYTGAQIDAAVGAVANKADKIAEVNHGTSDTTFTLTANTMHIWGTVSSLTLSLPTDSNSVLDEYMFTFTSGSTATTLSLPSSVKWVQDIEVETNKTYQVSIVNNLAGWLTNGMPSGGGSGGGGENNVIESISVNGVTQTVSAKNVDLLFKTINNESISGTGNISISGGGGEANVIESISVNNVAQTVTNKNVNITVPTKVSDLTNDSGFTSNTGTITGITMNNASKGTSGVVDLGTVVTSETSLSKGSTSGSGNAVTDLSVSGHTITLTKGKTFLESESDPIFAASAAYGISSSDITNWNGKTSNTGTITSVKMNGSTIASSGEADLGTVLTSHQSIKTLNSTSLVGTGNITINGLPSVSSSDNGKVLEVSSGSWTAVKPVTIYSGSSAPSSGTGSNGDIYIQTS